MPPDEENLTERQFWAILARRVSREMQKHPICKQRWLWCDGLFGERYFVDSDPRRITGVAWIDYGRGQEEWKFSLILPTSVSASDVADIAWTELAPRYEADGSFVIAFEKKEIGVRLS